MWKGSHFTLIVSQHPGEDGVLHEVIVGPTSKSVQLHQVLKVGYLSILFQQEMGDGGERERERERGRGRGREGEREREREREREVKGGRGGGRKNQCLCYTA